MIPGVPRRATTSSSCATGSSASRGTSEPRGPSSPEVVAGTRSRYVQAFERITGAPFERYLAEDVIGP